MKVHAEFLSIGPSGPFSPILWVDSFAAQADFSQSAGQRDRGRREGEKEREPQHLIKKVPTAGAAILLCF